MLPLLWRRCAFLAAVLVLSGCSKGPPGDPGAPGEPGAAGAPGVTLAADPKGVLLNATSFSGALQPNTSFNISGDGVVGGFLKSPRWGTTVLLQTAGPLPLTLNGGFETHGGTVQLFVSGTAWLSSTVTTHKMGAIEVVVDGVSVGALQMFLDQTVEHQEFPPRIFMPVLGAGNHDLTLDFPVGVEDAGYTSDDNDHFEVVLTELPF